jgi:hypothetical protein
VETLPRGRQFLVIAYPGEQQQRERRIGEQHRILRRILGEQRVVRGIVLVLIGRVLFVQQRRESGQQ